MNVALWIAQGLLAAIFLASGSLKISMSKEKLIASGQTGVAPFPPLVIRLTAACELLAALGLVLPLLTGIAPILTPIAALGLVIVMIGATASHLSLREPLPAALTTVILLICVLTAVGRLTLG
ncbi:MAG TPA: DoxX family protein [Pseudonocardiaceae bacterium]